MSDPATTRPPPRRVPEAYLRAEVAAFPLASEVAFDQSVVRLDPTLPSGGPTNVMWRRCETLLAPHTGWSLDRLVAARDLSWFGEQSDITHCAPPPCGPSPGVSLYRYLRSLARSHLAPRAGMTRIQESRGLTSLDAADHYRWLTLTLPEDLLLAALDVDPAPRKVDDEPPLLVRRLLDLGVAEIHQHIGAGMDFPLMWVSALAALADPKVGEESLSSPGAPFNEGRSLIRWMLAAAVTRCALGEYLITGNRDFTTFLEKSIYPRKDSAWTPRRRSTLLNTFHGLATADQHRLPDIEALRDLYTDLHPAARRLDDTPLTSVADAYLRCDPIAFRLGLKGDNAGEQWFLRHAFDRLKRLDRHESAPGERLFERLFWQTIRIRCQYFRTVVERPLTSGLQWFLRFYNRISCLRDPLEPILPQVSYEVAGEGDRVRALELRTSAGNTSVETAERLLRYLRSWQRVLEEKSNGPLAPEFGMVFHFVKERDRTRKRGVGWKSGSPGAYWAGTYGDPRFGGGNGRYFQYFAKQSAKARGLAELISAVPSVLWLMRGLDVATDEMGIPTWVMVPLFRHVTDEAIRNSIRDKGLPPLQVTGHVGEDFRHLMEGLRRIYEYVHYILDGNGGRLGHAIALGVVPQGWAESVGSVLMPAEERLWDLVWEWRLYSRYRIRHEYAATPPDGRIEDIANRVRELSDHIFHKIHPLERLAEAHHILHRFLVPPYASRTRLENGFGTFVDAAKEIKTRGAHMSVNRLSGIHGPKAVAALMLDYFTNEQVFRRGQTVIDIPVRSDEVAALDAVQWGLRRGLSQNNVVVEVNPSSNLLIGDLLDLRNHPILRLSPPKPEPGDPPPVAIAIGSDDPLTFSTDLLQEYTFLHQAARAAGYPERVAHEWLESIRRTGMDARFTRAWSPNATKMAARLAGDLEHYLQEPERNRCAKK